MYTFDNPIRFGDSGGNKSSQTAMFAMVIYFHKDTIQVPEDGNVSKGGAFTCSLRFGSEIP